WSSFLSIICLSSPMFGFNDRQLHRIQDSLIAQLGHLPKQDDESAKAWLYGKLLVALIVEKLIEHACSVSPWGYIMEEFKTAQCLERV
ncbi:MAG: hypothetical protein KZQ81_16520, partial [Candidatus Thiodiazotropha sp. (ex Rostrolucina anterorostrata)]|nr:hypothetical protein [Candidatus Thiodiazotropha sp. (ex Rostrolucina anterorostrata)]